MSGLVKCNGPTSFGAVDKKLNKAEIVAELENMVDARLFGRRRWLADDETFIAVNRKLIQLGLLEVVRFDPLTWRITPLGRELDGKLFKVFLGIFDEFAVPGVLEDRCLMTEPEAERIYERMTEDNAESVLGGYVKRAYLEYRNAGKFLH
jgi:hypothetical protein